MARMNTLRAAGLDPRALKEEELALLERAILSLGSQRDFARRMIEVAQETDYPHPASYRSGEETIRGVRKGQRTSWADLIVTTSSIVLESRPRAFEAAGETLQEQLDDAYKRIESLEGERDKYRREAISSQQKLIHVENGATESETKSLLKRVVMEGATDQVRLAIATHLLSDYKQ